MEHATRLPRWVWGAAITALVFLVVTFWLLPPIARKREELARGLYRIGEIEKLVDETWDALPPPPPPPPPPGSRPPPPPPDDGYEGGPAERDGLRARFAGPRARLAAITRAAKGAPAIHDELETLIRRFDAIEEISLIRPPPRGGPPRPGSD